MAWKSTLIFIICQICLAYALNLYDAGSNGFAKVNNEFVKNDIQKLEQKVLSVVTDEEIQMLLDVHNDLRRTVRASNMNFVVSVLI